MAGTGYTGDIEVFDITGELVRQNKMSQFITNMGSGLVVYSVCSRLK